MEPTKKISFGFSKSSKISNIFNNALEEKKEIELIDCLEGHSIKIKNAKEETKSPLIIPLRDDAKNLLDRVKQSRIIKNDEEEIDNRPDSELTLDELAARELIREARKQPTDSSETKVYSLPVATSNNLPTLYDNEPTLNDYESVPISDYGLAMLRGMGWIESSGIGKQNKQVTKPVEPELRPKGMGLGVSKVINLKRPSPPVDKDGKELSLVKGAYAKIIAGKHNGNYCEVMGLDDESGRIIVKTTINHDILSLNEFLVVPVTKEEYLKCSRVINIVKYEEHKKKGSISDKQMVEPVYAESSKTKYKPSKRRRYNSSSSSEEKSQSSRNRNKDSRRYQNNSSSDEDKYIKKRKDRSENAFVETTSRDYRYRSPSNEYKKKSNKSNRRRSKSPEIKDSSSRKYKDRKSSDSSDLDDYKTKKYNGSKHQGEEKKYKRKKSKKHKKHKQDSYSSDEEYEKKKKKSKSKKYTDYSSSSSDEDTYRKSKNKRKKRKDHR